MSLFQLAIGHEENIADAMKIVDTFDLEKMPPSLFVDVSKKIIKEERFSLAQTLSNRLGPDYLKEHPLVDLALGIAGQPPSEKERQNLEKLQRGDHFDDRQRTLLSGLYQAKGYRELAHESLEKVEDWNDVEEGKLYDLANLYIELDMVEKGIELVDKERERRSIEDSLADEAWLLLATAGGEEQEVYRALDRGDDVESQILEDLFSVALENGEEEFIMNLALRRYESRPDAKGQSFLATAMLLGDEKEKGQALFDELLAAGNDVYDPYMTALNKAAKQQPRYSKDLYRLIAERLKKGEVEEKKRRDYGYLLADYDFNEEAAALFFELAQERGLAHPDMQMLLHLWGEKPTGEQKSWIVGKTAAAKGDEKGAWMKHMINIGASQEALALVNEDDLDNEKIGEAYVGAAADVGDREVIADAVTQVYPRWEGLPQLKSLGVVTTSAGLNDLAEKIYEKVLAKEPGDLDAIKALGIIAYRQGRYSLSRERLLTFLQAGGEDYLVTTFVGELYWRQDEKRCARAYFRKALRQLRKNRGDDADQIEAQLLIRLDHYQGAEAIYKRLLAQDPDNGGIRADYANMLMNLEYDKMAACLLSGSVFAEKGTKKKNQAALEDEAKYRDITWVRILKESNHIRSALKYAYRLQNAFPCEPDGYSALADVYFAAGRWRKALQNLKTAIALDPKNEALREQQKELLLDHRTFAVAEYEYRKTGLTQRERFFRCQYAQVIKEALLVDFRFEHDHLTLDSFTDVEGVTAPFDGRRVRGDLSCTYTRRCGNSNRLTLYGAKGVWGVGALWQRTVFKDIFSVEAEYNRPNWDFVQSEIQQGSRDRVSFSRYHRFNRYLEGTLAGMFSRYNLKALPSAASSWKVEGVLTYHLGGRNPLVRFCGNNRDITLNYSLDKEERLQVKHRLDSFGTRFAPLPLINREVHSWFIRMAWDPRKWLAIEGYGGYNYDRVTGGSMKPIGGVGVTFWERDGLQGRLVYNHSSSAEQSDDIVDSLIANLKYRF